ncbi:MAG: ORF6N domain-containing protein [Verrucomicrobiia bacterium]|jgi:hypothetical protein
MPDKDSIIPIERVEQCIYVIRGQKVILDADLARIYGVSTARLNQQVRRNRKKFPPDFVFELTREEFDNLMLHFATSSSGYGGRRKLPLAFTEHGAIMTATVLNSPQAVLMSVLVVRAFVQMRETFANHHELVRQFVELERRLTGHDVAIRHLFDVIRQLLGPPESKPELPRRQIGFTVRERKAVYRDKRRKAAR